MRTPAFTKRFQKDVDLQRRRGKNLAKLRIILGSLINEEALDQIHRDHKLVGDYIGRRESHVESDWLLIYKLSPGIVIFERTGSHSDLFR